MYLHGDEIQRVGRLNERAKKTLNDETPAERFHQSVPSTG
jgi:hypothetical protein